MLRGSVPLVMSGYSTLRASSSLVSAVSHLYKTTVSYLGGKDMDQSITLEAFYQDSNPSGAGSRATVVALHGAPGSHNDFKYMLPLFKKKNIRLIGVNYPGHGFTQNDHRLCWHNEERNAFVESLMAELELLNKKELIGPAGLLIMGHSRGGENALQIGVNHIDDITGIIMMNCPGVRPHRGIRPWWRIALMIRLAEMRSLNSVILPVLNWVYNNVLGLRVPSGEVAACSLFSLRTFAFDRQIPLAQVVSKHPKCQFLYAYGGDDFLIEPEHSDELALHFDGIKMLKCKTKADAAEDAAVTAEAVSWINSGNRLVSCQFEKEGHFVQKFRANFVVQVIDAMIRQREKSL